MAKRLKAMGLYKYRNGFDVTIHHDVLKLPLTWKKPQMIFVNSMSDLFHEKVPLEFVKDIFNVMANCPQHIFQILTKRSKKLKRLHSKLIWPDNVWMGVTVESREYKFRINDLRATNSKVKFISFEPLLGHLGDIDLSGIDWAIAGGESGPGARPMDEKWVIDIKKQCRIHKTKFFFKQWGGVNKKKTGRELNGRTYDEMPSMPQFSI
jgi:protein gp37